MTKESSRSRIINRKGEIQTLYDFMHADFRHAVLRGSGRDGKVIVEFPPRNVCSMDDWCELLGTVLGPEIEELHPKLRRMPIFVRFAEKIFYESENVSLSGNARVTDGETFVILSLEPERSKPINASYLLYIMMHEICEVDFWCKASKNEMIPNAKTDLEELRLLEKRGGFELYNNLLDEKIANRRALRAVKRAWPNLDIDFPHELYNEDR